MPEETSLPEWYKSLLRFVAPGVLFVGRHLFKWNRLAKITTVPLGCPIADVIKEYGDPIESKPVEDFPEATCHTFSVTAFHEAVIMEWKGRTSSITYWSEHAAPNHDLEHMFRVYGEGIEWNEYERGYWYHRADGKVRLWCSVAPAIGVALSDYLNAKGEFVGSQKEQPERAES